MGIDLHIHSSFSDGLLTPEELVKTALDLSLSVIAITDHDEVMGIKAGLKAAGNTRLTVIPGLEINAENSEAEVHILGYGFDYQNPELLSFLKQLKQHRLIRAEKIVEKLNALGLKLELAQVLCQAKGESVGRPHIAQAMVKQKWVSNIQQAFDKYLTRGKPAYVPREKIPPEKAVSVIKQFNGIPVLAHPGLLKCHELLPHLIPYGLEGIEVYYPEHTYNQERELKQLAQHYGLLVTGGSDFHGFGETKSNYLGRSYLSFQEYAAFKERLYQLQGGGGGGQHASD